MNQGYPALTEKEKQTLRLLVDGHDAKSMARLLGLSVHTVNERLRDARRKMAVSSSREAARQLREVEGRTPEMLGDEPFGDASTANGIQQPGLQAHSPGITRRKGLIIGGLVMSFVSALYILMSLSGSVQPAASPLAAEAAEAAETATVAAARKWLALVDAGDWQASWDATGQAFKAPNTLEVWTKVSTRVRTPLGAVRSRELIGAEFVPAPPNGYWIVKFRTDFANAANTVETLSLAREDDNWRVVGCTIG